VLVGMRVRSYFWDENVGGDGSAIVLFGMRMLVGMGVRSYFLGCQCWWGWECDRACGDVGAGGGESAIASVYTK